MSGFFEHVPTAHPGVRRTYVLVVGAASVHVLDTALP